MIENFYAVIMAGGGGTRLWPLSRQSRPKQMLKLGQERSLFQVAVDRLQAILPPERILIVTVEDQAPGLQEQCPEIPPENFLLETMPRGTASVVGYAATVLNKKDPESVMAVLTADHIIGNLKLFHQILQASNQVAGENYLVTLGITPTFPATGYGYTRRGDPIGKYQELEVFNVREFTEKPALPEAEKMYQERRICLEFRNVHLADRCDLAGNCPTNARAFLTIIPNKGSLGNIRARTDHPQGLASD